MREPALAILCCGNKQPKISIQLVYNKVCFLLTSSGSYPASIRMWHSHKSHPTGLNRSQGQAQGQRGGDYTSLTGRGSAGTDPVERGSKCHFLI